MNGKFIKVCIKKWEKMGIKLIPSASCDCCYLWTLWPSMQQQKAIPRDVPKVHLAVYVGKDYKRYVINVAILKHPFFNALLDQAGKEYGFNATSKLCIPCDDDMFLNVIWCATSPQDRRISLYFSQSIRGACFNS